MSQKKAIIVGAGIGGLCAAIALHKKGWQIQLIEQAAAIRELGAGIQLSPNACRVLDSLGVLKAVAEKAFVPEALEMRWGRSGKRVFRIDIAHATAKRWRAPYLHVHRADLISVLNDQLHKLAGNRIALDARLKSASQRGELVTATLENGTKYHADLLIAADGVHSQVRQQIFTEPKAQFTGHIAWRAVVPMQALRGHEPPATACVWVGPQRHAVTYRLRQGELANFVGVVEQSHWDSESWSATGDKNQALADFANWHPSLLQMIQQARKLNRWALLAREPLPKWHHGHIALLGDACHAMLPFMAQGAAMAIEDAASLANALEAEPSIETGLQRYFQARIQRTSEIQKLSLKNADRFHHASAAYYLPLCLGAKLFPNLALRQFDWIYKH